MSATSIAGGFLVFLYEKNWLEAITKALLYLVEPIVYVKKSSFKKAENPPQKETETRSTK
ncbi:MAG: hypothetical protein E7C97_03710 [Streptococcus sp.]|uniref:hypothetical protein n=1 Tax=Streptococcus sp. TaxID=1306 RepID=UPI002901077E|nr:hypothetical protein [Streptococcus sp.]MDU2588418.1 hypothetical protein [Streptococcus sp.]